MTATTISANDRALLNIQNGIQQISAGILSVKNLNPPDLLAFLALTEKLEALSQLAVTTAFAVLQAPAPSSSSSSSSSK